MDVATAKRILEQALAGQIADDWQVYRAKRSYFYELGIIFLLIGVVIVVAGALFVQLALTQPYDPAGLISDAPTRWMTILLCLLVVVIGVGFVWVGGAILFSLRTVKQQLLVITPDGFVQRNGPRERQILVVAYERLESIRLIVTNDGIWGSITLNMVMKPTEADSSSRPLSWEVDRRFRPRDAIAQAIIAGQARYAAEHPVATAPRGEGAGVTSA